MKNSYGQLKRNFLLEQSLQSLVYKIKQLWIFLKNFM